MNTAVGEDIKDHHQPFIEKNLLISWGHLITTAFFFLILFLMNNF